MPTGTQREVLRKRLSSEDDAWATSCPDWRAPGVACGVSLGTGGRPGRLRGLSRTGAELPAGPRAYTTARPVPRSQGCSTSPSGSQGGALALRAAHRSAGRRKGENCPTKQGYMGISIVARHSRLSKQLMVRLTYLRSTR